MLMLLVCLSEGSLAQKYPNPYLMSWKSTANHFLLSIRPGQIFTCDEACWKEKDTRGACGAAVKAVVAKEAKKAKEANREASIINTVLECPECLGYPFLRSFTELSIPVSSYVHTPYLKGIWPALRWALLYMLLRYCDRLLPEEVATTPTVWA